MESKKFRSAASAQSLSASKPIANASLLVDTAVISVSVLTAETDQRKSLQKVR